MDLPRIPFLHILGGVLAIIAVVVVDQALVLEYVAPVPLPESNVRCTGESIEVAYPYGGGMMGPHECAVQCDDHIRRYILYSDGQATQCEPLPGCSDWGEDNGTTCEP